MSRTYHHGNKAKKRRFGDAWRWLSNTPSWWTRMFFTRPQRHAVRRWERDTERLLDPEDVEPCPRGNKGREYFW